VFIPEDIRTSDLHERSFDSIHLGNFDTGHLVDSLTELKVISTNTIQGIDGQFLSEDELRQYHFKSETNTEQEFEKTVDRDWTPENDEKTD
jgi:hypothetical protein